MKRDFTSKKKWKISIISGFDARKEPGGKADIASESYQQTIFRRFRHHHLALVSLIVVIVLGGAALLAPIIAPYSAALPVRNSGWEPTRLGAMCSAGFCMPCGYPFWWE